MKGVRASKGLFYRKYTIEKTLKHHIIEWFATVGSLTGVLMVAMKIRSGFGIWIVANVLWMWFAYKHKHWGLLFLSTCYLIINTYGFLTW